MIFYSHPSFFSQTYQTFHYCSCMYNTFMYSFACACDMDSSFMQPVLDFLTRFYFIYYILWSIACERRTECWRMWIVKECKTVLKANVNYKHAFVLSLGAWILSFSRFLLFAICELLTPNSCQTESSITSIVH